MKSNVAQVIPNPERVCGFRNFDMEADPSWSFYVSLCMNLLLIYA